MVIEFDDFGCNHIISDQCQTHDCRDVLLELKKVNPKLKVTLFSVPGEMTAELTAWCQMTDWVEIAVHGFFHKSNYECEKLSYDDFYFLMNQFKEILDTCFVKGFRAPGWQISTEAMQWLADNDYWIADQGYNTDRRPENLKAYVNEDGNFRVWTPGNGFGAYIPAHHGHVWNCMGNGIYEQFDYLKDIIKKTQDFKFVSEVVK